MLLPHRRHEHSKTTILLPLWYTCSLLPLLNQFVHLAMSICLFETNKDWELLVKLACRGCFLSFRLANVSPVEVDGVEPFNFLIRQLVLDKTSLFAIHGSPQSTHKPRQLWILLHGYVKRIVFNDVSSEFIEVIVPYVVFYTPNESNPIQSINPMLLNMLPISIQPILISTPLSNYPPIQLLNLLILTPIRTRNNHIPIMIPLPLHQLIIILIPRIILCQSLVY
mmetsp:Transcript_16076/g.34804  ORF Transcript_16076/g.34804 Transcript_16076/m.34804 type:complete len:224 (+) Transcript_16076:257-928(+)